MASRVRTVLEMIKFEHSVFALPFALTGALLAARFTSHGWPAWRQILWIIVAMVSARSAAMTINRIADLRFDKENPRTKMRALATGALSVSFAWIFTLIAIALFVVAAWQLNPVALKLSPVALAILFFYSFTKRFTNWSHLFLGFALGISPAAAWIAVTGHLDLRMLILCAAVTFWVGGFDVLYACQDVAFDQRAGLFSIPKRFGIAAALIIARIMHVGSHCTPCVARGKFRAALAGLGRNRGRGRAAHLRTFSCQSERLEQARRCVFHHERLY